MKWKRQTNKQGGGGNPAEYVDLEENIMKKTLVYVLL